jgi:hypothetical protein
VNVRRLVVAALLAVVALGAWAVARPRPAAAVAVAVAVDGPVLIVDQADGDEPRSRAIPDGAVALALDALSPDEAERLRAALDELATRLEARAHPLAVDLDDERAPDAALAEALRTLRPKLTAAESLTTGRWRSRDRSLVVTVAARCPEGDRHARCFPLADARADGVERWARFSAWPVAAAGVIELASADDARAAAVELRARAASLDSKVSLVIAPELDAHAPRETTRAIAACARRLSAVLGRTGDTPSDQRVLLEALAADARPARLPWTLKPREIVVVPRLGALSNLAAFTTEIESVIGRAPSWRQRPSSLD